MENKKYIIIGGSSGIGLSLINLITAEGHHVYHFARNRGTWENESQIQHTTLDILSDELPDTHGIEHANGLVYCPGTIELKSFHQLSDENFRNEFEINVVGAIKLIRHFLKALKKSRSASIVLFSTVAVGQGMPFHAGISTAKGAIEGLTRSLAAEFAPSIRVNAIAPSLTETRLAEKFLGSDERREAAGKRHPLGRIGRAIDIASMASFLLSERSDWITGQILHVDGGLSALRK
ncbi:MAG: SDR family oxidoreductase [Cyclobacteriaceae bacterium]|nr:SDR family oxidoreductase [Cyclobacteriaceae bacterium]